MKTWFLLCVLVVSFSASASSKQIDDVLKEIKFDTSKLKEVSKEEDGISWIDGDGDVIALEVLNAPSDFPNPSDLSALRNTFRSQALKEKDKGIVEVDPIKIGRITVGQVLTKFFRTDNQGFGYQNTIIIPTKRASYMIYVGSEERGTTGVRESTVRIICTQSSDKNYKMDLKDVENRWFRDPYDSKYDKGAKYCISDDKKYDEHFPDHPLTKVRRKAEALIKGLKLSDQIIKDALYSDDLKKK